MVTKQIQIPIPHDGVIESCTTVDNVTVKFEPYGVIRNSDGVVVYNAFEQDGYVLTIQYPHLRRATW